MADLMESNVILDTPLVQKAERYVREHFDREIPPQYVYHNFDHTKRVAAVIGELADEAHVTDEEKENLVLSALFHDTGFSISAKDHETHSKEIAARFLAQEGVPESRINEILKCIDATRLGHAPSSRLEMLIKDADTSSLGEDNFFEITEQLRQELNIVNEESIDEKAWDRINLEFLKEHEFYTEEAKNRFTEAKKKHIKKIEKKLKKGGKKEKEKVKAVVPRLLTIGSSKSAQTQFKTSLRNHIDLSSIADNKANMMLSVNALIITIALPLLGERIASDKKMLIPTLILLAVCIIAMVFATLATRPIPMAGRSSLEDIKGKKSNLFFFGNFFQMSFQEYEEGMRVIVGDDELLDNAITRDLFFLGKALGKKYQYLRLCYNFFMYGLILAVLAFGATFVLGAR
ncbi:MAG TPA: Pycsar system effector family protein [Saprospiraceae bacterium]|nr:Pycsar system effector family protein [Saprospiraceae bacterium]